MTSNDSRSVIQAVERAIGPENVSEEVAGYSVDGAHPRVVAFPSDIGELGQVMDSAWQDSLAVAPWGGGTRMTLGNTISRLDAVVDISRLNRIVQLNPDDLTATVEAGVPVAVLQQALAEHGQFLALDPPLSDRATVGGTLATGVSGPLKWHYGNPRDLVIGIKVVQADGKLVKSGGQVVKNVSGYDMARLHIGGLGTLGVIAEVSFKVTPLPKNEVTIVAAFDSSDQCLGAGQGIFSGHVMPMALAAFDSEVNRRGQVVSKGRFETCPYILAVRLGGRPLTLERQINECLSICKEQGAGSVDTLDDARSLWKSLSDFGWDEATAPAVSARVSHLTSEVRYLIKTLKQPFDGETLSPAVISHPGYGTTLINWYANGTGFSDDVVSAVLSQTRDTVHKAGGRMIIERCPAQVKPSFDVWDDVGGSLAVMRSLKKQYDPKGVLNPGRFVGGI